MKMFFIALLFTLSSAFAQQQINTLTTKDLTINGQYNVNSTTLASKPCPVMTQTQRDALTATQGKCVYNSTTTSLNVYNGSTWGSVGGGLSSWVTAFNYGVGDVVIQSSFIYQCATAHTSGTFATDLASGKWTLLSPNVDLTTNQTVGGTKTFSNTIVGSISGNAATVTTNANLTGEVTSVGNAATVSNAAVIAKTLTGFSSAAGTISSTDSILQALQKADGNDALKQSRSTLTTKGDLYVATASGTTTRLAAGANDTVLVADSAQSSGLKFATPFISTKSEQGSAVSTTQLIAPNFQLTNTATGVQRVETNSRNILNNPSFENVVYDTGWTAGLGTKTQETTLVQDGVNSLKIVSAGAGVRLTQCSTVNAANLKGLRGIARAYIDTTDTVMQVCALVDGTSSGFDTGCKTVTATAGAQPFQLVEVPFTMGGTCNGIVIKTATTTTQPTYIDDTFVGPSSGFTDLTGDVTSVGTVTTLTNAPVIAKVLTGFTSGAGTVTGADSILQAFQKIDGNDALKQSRSTLTTKGDVYVATASGVTARQGVGADDTVLTADSTVTNGVSYKVPKISTKAQSDASSTTVTEIQAPNNQLTTTATNKRLIETDNDNLLINPDMEGLSSGGVADSWTNSSTNSVASITTNTSEITSGTQAQKIVLTSGILNFSSYKATSTGIQKQGYVLGTYAAPSSWTDFQVCSVVDSNEQTCVPTTSLILDGNYHQVTIPIVFGSISAGIKFKTTSAVTGTFLADKSKVAPGLALKNVTVDTDLINAGALTVTAVTSNPTKGTVVVDRFLVSRRGQWIEALYQYQQSAAGSAGSGQYIWNLPSGYTFDTNYITPFAGSSVYSTPTALSLAYVGTGSFSNPVSGVSTLCRLYAYSSTSFRAVCLGTSADSAATQWAVSGAQFGFAEAASMNYTFNVRAPMSGWASNSTVYSAANSNFAYYERWNYYDWCDYNTADERDDNYRPSNVSTKRAKHRRLLPIRPNGSRLRRRRFRRLSLLTSCGSLVRL
jgi:hypothetical protein